MTNRETSDETLHTAQPARPERVDHYPGEGVVERPVAERPVVEQRVVHEPAHRHVVATASPVDTARRVVWLAFGVLQALLILRIVLLMLGANEANDLVAFILAVTDPFVAPFRGMFTLDSVDGASGSVLDVAAVVALIAWTLVEALVLGLVGLADRRATTA
jgi:uncharacterized protein YggT (Ycf19 family)